MKKHNSYTPYLLGAYAAMLVDIADQLPSLRVEIERDSKRLLSIIEKEGDSFLMISLPEFGKHFDRCLADARLYPSEVPHMGIYRAGTAIPRLFKGLLLNVFDDSGVLKDQPCITSIGAVRQLCFAAKRFRMTCSDSAVWRQTNEFYKIEEELPPPSIFWTDGDADALVFNGGHICALHNLSIPAGDLFGESQQSSRGNLAGALACVQFVADIVASELGWFNPTESRFKHGPGAVSDRRRDVSKYIPMWWPDTLESVFPIADIAYHNYAAAAADSLRQDDGPTLSGSSRLIAVPKTLKAPRLIAAEPTANQWCQQSIRDFLANRVRHTILSETIDFDDQTPNQVLALEGSRTGEWATIDLSSASDRIACILVEHIFRRNIPLLKALQACRTQYISNDIDRKFPALSKLRKFSTMGSAVTFPVQTILFSVVAAGCVLYQDGLGLTKDEAVRATGKVRVFGDDIIVPTTSWTLVQEVLEALGLRVNHNKTFGTGKFRESCGCDAYDGVNITPVGIISSPDVTRPGSIASAVDSHNNLVMRGWWSTAAYVKSIVDGLGKLSLPIIPIGSGAFGWYSADGLDISHLERRFNIETQKLEVWAHVPVMHGTRSPTEGDPMLLQYFTEVCKPPTRKEDRLGVASVPATKLRRRWVPVERLEVNHL